ncbi:MAG: aspartate aminotransferase family protein [Cytophagales bacterium]|nr:aspartate aminotransferase family protein [Cytophagales bacterium]
MNVQSDLQLLSEEVFAESGEYIAGGVVSLNRKVNPRIVFKAARGSKLYDLEGREYVDYHAAFAPFLLGHNHEAVNGAAMQAMQASWSLMGTGTTLWEMQLAKLLCRSVPSLELVQITNTGSEATAHAIRLSRAYTGREDIILTMGGYNGWHNEVSRAVMPSLAQMGPWVSPGEYPFIPMSAGIPEGTKRRVHVVNFNDLDSIEYVMRRYPVACVLTEPVLQNVGVVLPKPGYLQGVRDLCDTYGAVCVFDEVKTGFRTALGGYQGVAGVQPHLSVFGKAVANGFPLGVIGGKREIMQQFDHPDPARRVLIAGTYNAHPFNAAAAIATLEILQDPAVYAQIAQRSNQLYAGLEGLFAHKGIEAVVARNASAFCVYFSPEAPAYLHDILTTHNFEFDAKYRLELIKRGVYHIPLPCKQGSVSLAHTAQDIDRTLEVTEAVLRTI